MANETQGTAVGAILQIPKEALESIDNAEKAIKRLAETSENAAKSIKRDFGTTAVEGMDAFIRKIKEAQTAMANLGATSANTQAFEKSLSGTADSAKRASDNILSVAQGLSNMAGGMSNALGGVQTDANKLGDTFNQLSKLLTQLQQQRDKQTVGSAEAQSLNDQIEALKEKLKLEKQSTEQRSRVKTDPEKDYLTKQKALLLEIVGINKQINAQNVRVETGKITGSATLTADTASLNRLVQSYSEATRKLRELNDEKGRDLGFAARAQAEAQTEKFNNEMLKEHLKSRQLLNAAQQRANELTAAGQQGKSRLGSSEEATIQRQLNSDYKEMLKIIKQQGELKAKAAAEGRRLSQDEINLITTLGQRYKIYFDDVKRLTPAYQSIANAAKTAFDQQRMEQMQKNAVLYADALRKAQNAMGKTSSAMAGKQTDTLGASSEELARLTQRYLDLTTAIDKFNKKKFEDTSATERQQNKANEAERQQLLAILPLLRERVKIMAQTKTAAASYTNPDLQTRRSADELAKLNAQLREEEKASKKAAEQFERDRIKEAKAAQKAHEQQQKTYDKLFGKGGTLDQQKISSPTGAIAYAQSAKNLNELIAAYKNLKKIMSETDPKSSQWQQMNAVYKDTKNKIDDVKKAMGDLKEKQSDIADSLGALGQGLATIFSLSSIWGFLKKMTEVHAQFELQNVSLRAILQNKQDADRIFERVQQMAMQSPFTIMQLNTYVKQLAAYRIESEKLLDTTKMLADVSAGLGVDMQRLILAYGQVKSANYLRACLGKGTKVKMFDGTYKNVEDIVVGDVLMGDDEQPRHVSRLYQGQQQMYRVSYLGGEFRCNEHHILTVYDALDMRIKDVFVLDYLQEHYRYHGVRRINGEYKSFVMRVESDNIDTYYGFTIDGNHRFIIEDNIVTHNTEVRQFTEAGLNVSGELAKYFSELKGEMVSVGQVTEMITKRMVKFEDVAEIFRRITSEGGMFYDMQKKQSESVYGQLQRIQDAYSIMLNEIGESSHGLITWFLSAVRGLIANWEKIGILLSGLTISVIAYTRHVIAAAAATNALGVSHGFLTKNILAATKALKGFFAFLAKNPYVILVSALVAAGFAAYNYTQKMNAMKEAHDENIRGVQTNIEKLDELTKKLNKTQEGINATKSKLKELKSGTREYADTLEANNKATSEQLRLLQQLRNDFPEVYAQITKTKKSVEGLAEATENYLEVLRAVQIVEFLDKEHTGLMEEDWKKDMSDASEAQTEYNAKLKEAEVEYKAFNAQLDTSYNLLKRTGKLTASDETRYNKLLAIRNSALSVEEKIERSISEQGSKLKSDLPKLSSFVSVTLATQRGALRSATEEAAAESARMFKNILTSFGYYSIDEINKLSTEERKVIVGQIEGAMQVLSKNASLTLDDIQQDILNRTWMIPLGIQPFWQKEVTSELNGAQKLIQDYVDKHPGFGLPDIKPAQELSEYFRELKGTYEAEISEYEKYTKAQVRYDDEKTNAQLANEMKLHATRIKNMAEYFGYSIDGKKGGRGSTKDAELQRLQNLKKAITEVANAYEKARETADVTTANKQIQRLYGDVFKELGVSINDFYADGTYGAKSLIKALNLLLDITRDNTDARKKFRSELQREISDTEIEITAKLSEESQKNIQKGIDKIWSSYDISKSLQEMGMNIDLSYSVGHKPIKDLSEVRKELEEMFESLGGKDAPTNIVKMFDSAFEQLEKKSQSYAQERMKNYSKYLLQSVSERVRIETEAAQQIAAIRAKEDYDDDAKQRIIDNIRKETEQKLDSLTWKEFTGTDTYIQMFEDLGTASVDALTRMQIQLRSVQNELKNLPADQLKQVIDAMNKLDDEIIKRNPFKGMKEDLAKIIQYGKERKQLEADIAANTEKSRLLQSNIEEQERIVIALEAEYKAKKDNANVSEEEKQILLKQLVSARNLLNIWKRQKQQTDAALDSQNKKQEDGNEAAADLAKRLEKIRELWNKFKTPMQSVVDGLEQMGSLSESFIDTWNGGTSVFEGVLDTAVNAVSAYAQFQSGNMMGAAQSAIAGVGSLVKTIGAIGALGDKKKERQIQRLKEKVESLKDAYDKLHTAMERAYVFDDYNANFERQMANLAQQEAHYREMIRLEMAKKKTDDEKIKEYQKALDEIAQTRQDIRDTRYEQFGSIAEKSYLSEAEAFVSAWLDAYQETGDGLDALTDHWDEFFKNLMLKQMASSVISKRMAKYIDAINNAIDEGVTGQDLATIAKEQINLAKTESAEWNEILKSWMEALGITGAGSSTLSDLQKGIQNITEPQAAAIEAYLNSMRFAVYRHTEQLDTLIAVVSSQYGGVDNSPMIVELQGIRGVLDRIDSTLSSIIEKRPARGNAIRVA